MVESHILIIPMEFMGFFMRALTRQYRDQWNNIIRFWKKTDPEEISQIFIIFDEKTNLTIFHTHNMCIQKKKEKRKQKKEKKHDLVALSYQTSCRTQCDGEGYKSTPCSPINCVTVSSIRLSTACSNERFWRFFHNVVSTDVFYSTILIGYKI